MNSPLKRKRLGFAKAFNRLLRDPRILLQDKGLLLILKSFADADGSSCFPSIDLLAQCAGRDVKAVYEGISRLSKFGIVTRAKSGRHNVYLLNDEYFAKNLAKPVLTYSEKRKTSSERTPPGKRVTTKTQYQANDPVQSEGSAPTLAEDPPKIVPFQATG